MADGRQFRDDVDDDGFFIIFLVCKTMPEEEDDLNASFIAPFAISVPESVTVDSFLVAFAI